jgi:MFS family permease
MLWFVCFLNYADRQGVFALLPLLRSEFHLSNIQLALLGSSFMWTYALFGPVAGWLGDCISRKWLILGGLCLWLSVTVATIRVWEYWQLTSLRALDGIAEAVYFPAAMSLISSYHGPETRSRAMSIHQSAVYAGTIGGGVLASLFGEHFGWRVNFIYFGGLGLTLFLVLLAFLKEPQAITASDIQPEPIKQNHVSLRDILVEIFAKPVVLRLVVAFIGANFVAMGFMVWLPSFLFSKFHMSLAIAGANATIYLQTASVLGVLFGGVLGDRITRKDRGGRMRIQAFGALLGAVFLFFIGWTATVQMVILAMIGFGFCKGIYESSLWASLHDVVQPKLRATAVGVMNALGYIGGSIAPLAIATGSHSFGMGRCLSATSLVYIGVAAILLWNARLYSRTVLPLRLPLS